MIDYTLFQLAAPPFTGIEWITKAIQLAGLGYRNYHKAYQPFPPSASPVLRVSVVRHPADWLSDCYVGITTGRFNATNGYDPLLRLNRTSEDVFFRHYLGTMPGHITRMFRLYKADSYLRAEDLPWGLYELLESLDLPNELILVCKTLKWQPLPTSIDVNGLRGAIAEAEGELTDDFEYF